MTGRRRMTALVAVATIAAAACGGGGGGSDTSATPSPPASADAGRWIAVVEVAPRADDLDTATQRLREPLGTALVVSPFDCFEGLPAEAGEGYVIGALAGSSDEAERLVVGAGEPVLFTASVTILCVD
jgi:hypothetical protein